MQRCQRHQPTEHHRLCGSSHIAIQPPSARHPTHSLALPPAINPARAQQLECKPAAHMGGVGVWLLALLCITTQALRCSAGPVESTAEARGVTATDVKAAFLAKESSNYHRRTTENRFYGQVLAYVTPWNSKGYDAAVRWRAKFTHISPVWYQMKQGADANSIQLHGAHDVDQAWIARLRQPHSPEECAAAGTQTCPAFEAPLVVPRMLLELPPSLLEMMVNQPGQPIQLMLNEVTKHGFDGLVLEGWLQWAAVHLMEHHKFRQAALTFVRQLADVLHANGKVLLLAVPPVVPAQPGRPGAEVAHMQQVATEVDGWSVMTYDWSVFGPGPNAPLRWQEENVQALLADVLPAAAAASPGAAAVPGERVFMGINFYGYDFAKPENKPHTASAITGDAFVQMLRRVKPKLVWEDETSEHRVRYKEAGVRHSVYSPTPAALAARVQLAEQLGVGLSIWELGQGMDVFMDLL